MNWYLESGKDSDVVISTRIRFARNFRNYNFNIKEKQEALKVENEIKENRKEERTIHTKSGIPEIGQTLDFSNLGFSP